MALSYIEPLLSIIFKGYGYEIIEDGVSLVPLKTLITKFASKSNPENWVDVKLVRLFEEEFLVCMRCLLEDQNEPKTLNSKLTIPMTIFSKNSKEMRDKLRPLLYRSIILPLFPPTNKQLSLKGLPEVFFFHIAQFLEIDDLKALIATSKPFYELFIQSQTCSIFWSSLIDRDFPLSKQSNNLTMTTREEVGVEALEDEKEEVNKKKEKNVEYMLYKVYAIAERKRLLALRSSYNHHHSTWDNIMGDGQFPAAVSMIPAPMQFFTSLYYHPHHQYHHPDMWLPPTTILPPPHLMDWQPQQQQQQRDSRDTWF